MSIPTQFDPIGVNDWIPKGYELIESVFFNGNSYIDTGFQQTQGDTYHVEIIPYVNNVVGGWGANGSGGISYTFYAIRTDGTYYFGLGASYGAGGTLVSERTTIEFNPQGAFMNGEVVYKGVFATSNTRTWMLGAFQWYGPSKSKSRFFYGFIKRGGRLVAEYFPLKRLSDNTFHVYDRISKTFPTVIGDPLEE